jgi:hypothetical protein
LQQTRTAPSFIPFNHQIKAMQEQTLSISLSPESLGLAVFHGQRLKQLEAYWLHAMPKAAEACAGYVLRCIDTFNPTVALMQKQSGESPDVRLVILEALRATSRPVIEVEDKELFASYGDPPLVKKEELHQLVRSLFPQIPSNRLVLSCLDAVAAGLHFETKRLLESDAPA